jgi:hypothetical protein
MSVAAMIDQAHRAGGRRRARTAQAGVDLLIPDPQGWCTETGVEVASLGIQVHGGMGFIEETGAAQHLRDARITTIYEGTTASRPTTFIATGRRGRHRGLGFPQGAGAVAEADRVRRRRHRGRHRHDHQPALRP